MHIIWTYTVSKYRTVFLPVIFFFFLTHSFSEQLRACLCCCCQRNFTNYETQRATLHVLEFVKFYWQRQLKHTLSMALKFQRL